MAKVIDTRGKSGKGNYKLPFFLKNSSDFYLSKSTAFFKFDIVYNKKTDLYVSVAAEFIPKGSIIFTGGGKLFKFTDMPKIPMHMRSRVTYYGEKYWSVSTNREWFPLDHLTHNCKRTNVGQFRQLVWFAKENIYKGDGLTTEYSPYMPKIEYQSKIADKYSVYDFDCLCGEKNCRKKITGWEWKDPKFAKKFWMEWPPFIQKEIIKRKIIKFDK
jgi:hypothetical protein